jgi:hypothetical protein
MRHGRYIEIFIEEFVVTGAFNSVTRILPNNSELNYNNGKGKIGDKITY